MMFREIVDACFEKCKKYIKTLLGQSAEFQNIQAGGKFGTQCAARGQMEQICSC